MPKVSVTRRLLRQLSFVDVKEVNNFFDLQPRKSKQDMIGQIVPRVGTGLEHLVADEGPFSLVRWNKIIVELGGAPRKSFEAAALEISASLDPIFDALDGDTSIAELRGDKVAIRVLSRKLDVEKDEMRKSLDETNGHTLLSTFVRMMRAPQPQALQPDQHVLTVASTRTNGPRLDKLNERWLKKHLDGATEIAIAAGFYDVEFIADLFSGTTGVKRVRLLFNGLGGQRLEDQKVELQALQKEMEKFPEFEIRLAFAPGMFHTKLFLMTKNESVRALIGSANATRAAFTRNEELLVVFENADNLADYFDAAWKNAQPLGEPHTTADSLIAFFRTGVLYFKPVASLNTTLNPFVALLRLMTAKDMASLGGFSLPYADEVAGLGSFNLKRVVEVGVDEDPDDDDDEDEAGAAAGAVLGGEKALKASIKPWAIETCYGYWVPSILDDQWRKKLQEVAALKLKRLKAFRKKINALPDEDLIRMYGEYLDGARKVLEVSIPDIRSYYAKLKRKPFQMDNVEKFMQRVRSQLLDDEHLERLALPFISGAIPEIWEDGEAYRDFRRSFFEYLGRVSRQVGKRSNVPMKIIQKLDLDELVDLEDQFETYLLDHGWTDADWT